MPGGAASFLQAFIPLFVAMDPIGLAALYLALSQDVPTARRQRITSQALWTAGLVGLLFLFLGKGIFNALGISVQDFQVGGGLILFILATRDLVLSGERPARKLADDFGVVPLGMPIIAGPAMLATLLASAQSVGVGPSLAALLVNLTLVYVAFRCSGVLGKVIGQTGLRAVSKIISMLLAAIAVAMIRRGLGQS